ncbi:MAG: LysR family transcriptional regulator [Moraxella sp.]|nr:LysR family transcriptional regulator [Moraxella sp.]
MLLQQMRYFIHVAQTKSFSQSARLLGISQPSLSRHIGQLENVLGQRLFDRYHRPLILTPAGEFFLAHIRPNVSNLYQTIELTKKFNQSGEPNTLTIGFVASILYGLLPEIIATLRQKLPKLEVRLVEVGSNEQMQALKTGKIDVGFGRFLCDDEFVRQVFLRHERLVVALPIYHPLAQRSGVLGISFKELVSETLILYHRTPLPTAQGNGDQLLHLFNQHQLSPKHTTKASDIQIALGLVAGGVGVTLVPESLKSVRAEQIHYHQLHHENATSPIYMNTLSQSAHPSVPALLEAVYQVYDVHRLHYHRSA